MNNWKPSESSSNASFENKKTKYCSLTNEWNFAHPCLVQIQNTSSGLISVYRQDGTNVLNGSLGNFASSHFDRAVCLICCNFQIGKNKEFALNLSVFWCSFRFLLFLKFNYVMFSTRIHDISPIWYVIGWSWPNFIRFLYATKKNYSAHKRFYKFRKTYSILFRIFSFLLFGNRFHALPLNRCVLTVWHAHHTNTHTRAFDILANNAANSSVITFCHSKKLHKHGALNTNIQRNTKNIFLSTDYSEYCDSKSLNSQSIVRFVSERSVDCEIRFENL